MAGISCQRCRWFADEVLPEAERLRARLERYPSHRAMLEDQALEAAGWTTLRGRGGRAKIVRESVRRAEALWPPPWVPTGANVSPVRLGALAAILMGTQVWLDHLRKQPAGDFRGQVHAGNNGLGRHYDAEIGRALSAPAKNWPARRRAGMIHLTAVLLGIEEKTVQRRLAAFFDKVAARGSAA